MKLLIFIFTIFCCLEAIKCEKLTCNTEVISGNYSEEPFFFVFDKDSNGNLKPVEFDPSRKTVVIIHGFSVTYHEWIKSMAKLWLQRESLNVIVVAWLKNFSMQYKMAALGTVVVAEKITEYIMKFVNQHGRKLNRNFHFVGHSLGAHLAGQAARLLKEKHGLVVKRITGLDPAYPCFENDSASLRLRKTDAEFVDVIHTNSEPGKNKGNFGTYDLMGHLDFYPNGGDNQPGCKEMDQSDVKHCTGKILPIEIIDCNLYLQSLKANQNSSEQVGKMMLPYTGIDLKDFINNLAASKNFLCYHVAAIKYFIDSLNPNVKTRWANQVEWPLDVNEDMRLRNRQCNNTVKCIEMGINAELYRKNYTGAFFVDVSEF